MILRVRASPESIAPGVVGNPAMNVELRPPVLPVAAVIATGRSPLPVSSRC